MPIPLAKVCVNEARAAVCGSVEPSSNINTIRDELMAAAAAMGRELRFGQLARPDIEAAHGLLGNTPELDEFWAHAAPVDVVMPFSPDRLRLFAPADNASRRVGYLGEGWNEAWLIIGDVAGDPLIADTSRPGTPMMLAIHGTGDWTPATVAPNPSAFLAALTVWLQVLRRFDGERLDEDRDLEVKSGFDEVLLAELLAVLPADYARALIHYIST